MQLKEEEEANEFFVRLCGDVFLEILVSGNRRQLVNMERVDRRIHRLIENFLGKRPFLRLGLAIYPKEGTYILGKCYTYDKISPTFLAAFPSFLRFHSVELFYGFGTLSIEKKCEMFETCLLPLKPALNDSYMIEFSATISQHERNDFNNHSTLIDHLQNRLMSICDSARGYKFRISLGTDENENDVANVISSIIQMPTIERCSKVDIVILCYWEENKQLPVENISNWLDEKFLASEELFVRIYRHVVEITKLKSKCQKRS